MSKQAKLRKKYPIIKKGKKWWKGLSYKDKNAFIQGFKKNKQAKKIQEKETEFLKRSF